MRRSAGIRPNGVTEFRILEITEGRALIQATLDTPGTHPFWMRLIDLIPAESTDRKEAGVGQAKLAVSPFACHTRFVTGCVEPGPSAA